MKMIRLLIADTAPLYPPSWGGPKRIWNLYSNLNDGFDLTYVGIDCGLSKKYIRRKIKNNFEEIIRPITKIYYPFRYFELKIIRNTVFDIFIHTGMIFDQGFKHELKKYQADICIAAHPWAAPCFKKKKSQIFIYDAHNCEYALIKEILKGKWYKAMVSFFVKLIEGSACRKATAIIASSAKDKELFIELYKIAKEKVCIISNGACIVAHSADEKRKAVRLKLNISEAKPVLLFIGAYYQPNIEAAKFIVNELALKLPETELVLLGAVSEYFKNNNLPKNLRLLGKISDAGLSDWLTAADIGINPMFSGSGINMKMLDYFSFGLPVVATWTGARGFVDLEPKYFIACQPDEFVDEIKMLLNNAELRKNLGMQARRLAEENYDWKKKSEELSCLLRGLIKFGKND
jgi:glycosyltransferase involved in cell wall biosynthesis